MSSISAFFTGYFLYHKKPQKDKLKLLLLLVFLGKAVLL
jgi:hypothetical protein